MPQISSDQAILITGASTGIGEACVERFDREGWRVFGTVRSERDEAAMSRKFSERVTPILLDVTDALTIKEAAAMLKTSLADIGLAGLVNNAGIGIGGPLEFLPIHQLREQLEVNVIGQIAVMQAMMPLLRKGRGRIVYMGSISGRGSTPFLAPYAISKYALEAIADAQRLELRPWGMHVSVIEPGNIKTPIWEKTVGWAQKSIAAYPENVHQLYGKYLQVIVKTLEASKEGGIPASKVADVVHHAVTAKRPKNRYLVGTDAHLRVVIEALPDWLRDRLIWAAIERMAGS
jgi:NAD(P)-dependent dehydrogenase (short-subunit alcohol dehydrogenase family)